MSQQPTQHENSDAFLADLLNEDDFGNGLLSDAIALELIEGLTIPEQNGRAMGIPEGTAIPVAEFAPPTQQVMPAGYDDLKLFSEKHEGEPSMIEEELDFSIMLDDFPEDNEAASELDFPITIDDIPEDNEATSESKQIDQAAVELVAPPELRQPLPASEGTSATPSKEKGESKPSLNQAERRSVPFKKKPILVAVSYLLFGFCAGLALVWTNYGWLNKESEKAVENHSEQNQTPQPKIVSAPTDSMQVVKSDPKQAAEPHPVDAGNKVKLDGLLKTGSSAFAEKNLAGAEKAYLAAKILDPTNLDAAKGLQKVEQARRLVLLEQQRQAKYKLAMGAGQKAIDAKKYDEAVKSFKEALGLMPDDNNATQMLQQAKTKAVFEQVLIAGQAAMTRKKFDDAVKAYKEAVRLQPSDANAQKHLQQAELALKDLEKQKTIRELLKTGSSFLATKNLDAAEKAYRSASLLDPTNPDVVKGLKEVEQVRKVRPVIIQSFNGDAEPILKNVNLSGTWVDNDNGVFEISQQGDKISWRGKSFDGGKQWSNVFDGSLEKNGNCYLWTFANFRERTNRCCRSEE